MKIIRFGVSMEEKLLRSFDDYIKRKKYPNRSEAIRDLIRGILVKMEWRSNEPVAGVISMVYDHHKRELVNTLMRIQHRWGEYIISTQHIHLDHGNCLEIVAAKGSAAQLTKLYDEIKAVKGVKHASFSPTTLGKKI